MKIIAVVIVALLATASSASSQSGQAFQVVPPKDAKLAAQAKAVLPKLLKACPGLNRYAGDLSPASVNASQMSGYEGIEFMFQVASRPQQLPAPLNVRSASNNCYISVSADGSRAYIAKRACTSICEGVWQENSPGLMGRELKLR